MSRRCGIAAVGSNSSARGLWSLVGVIATLGLLSTRAGAQVAIPTLTPSDQAKQTAALGNTNKVANWAFNYFYKKPYLTDPSLSAAALDSVRNKSNGGQFSLDNKSRGAYLIYVTWHGVYNPELFSQGTPVIYTSKAREYAQNVSRPDFKGEFSGKHDYDPTVSRPVLMDVINSRMPVLASLTSNGNSYMPRFYNPSGASAGSSDLQANLAQLRSFAATVSRQSTQGAELLNRYSGKRHQLYSKWDMQGRIRGVLIDLPGQYGTYAPSYYEAPTGPPVYRLPLELPRFINGDRYKSEALR